MIRSGVEGKTGRIRLTGEELTALRRKVFERDGYKCVICELKVTWESGELMHIQSRGRGGSDTMENTECGCKWCHNYDHRPKAIRSKV